MAKSFRAIVSEAERHPEYWQQWPVNDFTEELVRRMETVGISRSGLAAKLGVSPAYVTKVLRGDVNLTVESLSRIARAAQSVVRIHLAPPQYITIWLDEVAGGSTMIAASNKTARFTFNGNPVQAEVRSVGVSNG